MKARSSSQLFFLFVAFLAVATPAFAYEQIVNVPAGGDVVAAVAAIGDAGPSNTYLVRLTDGVYNIGAATLQMKPYVDIEGAGQKATTIRGSAGGATAGVVVGASNAELRSLTIQQTGANAHSNGIQIRLVNPTIIDVDVLVTGASTYNYGIYVIDEPTSPMLTNVRITVSGGTNNFGISSVNHASPTIVRSVIGVTGGTSAVGIASSGRTGITLVDSTVAARNAASNSAAVGQGGTPTFRRSNFTASGGTKSHGILVNTGTPLFSDVKAVAYGASTNNYGAFVTSGGSAAAPVDFAGALFDASGNGASSLYVNGGFARVMNSVIGTSTSTGYGVYNNNSGNLRINNSTVRGNPAVHSRNSAAMLVGSSQIDGTSSVLNLGTISCINVFDGVYAARTCP